MPLDTFKSPLRDLYYLATLPQRKHLAAQRVQQKQVPVIVLFYHRVADHAPNPWTISNTRFRAQLRWIQQRFEIISLTTAQQRIASDANQQPAVCITFDDGYADNCDAAIPWLLENNVPFTYFVTSSNLLSGEPFAHDSDQNCPLAPNTPQQLRDMAAAGVEIGAHTRTHADLGTLAAESDLYDEIVGSKHDLEALLDTAVRYFAFPFGLQENMTTAAFRVAFQAGFWGVCSAYGGYNMPGSDSFHLQRIHGDPTWSRFRNWLSVDPRKLKHQTKFHPGNYQNTF